MESIDYIGLGFLVVSIILTFFVPQWLEIKDNEKWIKENDKRWEIEKETQENER